MAKHQSRPKRWADAITRAQAAVADLQGAVQDLEDLKEEYQDWRDSMPDNLEQSPLAEKLDEVTQLEVSQDMISEIDGALAEAESVDLPLGFGRD